MAGKTARRFPCKVQKNTEKADKPFLGNQYGRKNPKAELGNPRMDKLFSNWKNENKHAEDRRTPEDKNADCYLETVENKCEEILGTAKTQCT